MSKRLRKAFAVLSVVLLAAGLFYGCSSNPPTALPEYDNPNLQRTILLADGVAVSKLVDVSVLSDSLLINNIAGYHAFKIPQKALKAATIISIKTSREVILGKNAVVLEFGPDGLVFDRATTIDFDLRDLDPSAKSASLYYFDPNVGDWVYQGTANAKDGKVSFNIYHFSKYAIE